MTQQSNKVWFITGASRGFGRVWAEAALKRGDKLKEWDGNNPNYGYQRAYTKTKCPVFYYR